MISISLGLEKLQKIFKKIIFSKFLRYKASDIFLGTFIFTSKRNFYYNVFAFCLLKSFNFAAFSFLVKYIFKNIYVVNFVQKLSDYNGSPCSAHLYRLRASVAWW